MNQHDNHLCRNYSHHGKYVGEWLSDSLAAFSPSLLHDGALTHKQLRAPQHPQPSMADMESQNGRGMARMAGKGPGLKSSFFYLLAEGTWASHLTILCLSSLFKKIYITEIPYLVRLLGGLKEFVRHVRYLKNYESDILLTVGHYLLEESTLVLSYQEGAQSVHCVPHVIL